MSFQADPYAVLGLSRGASVPEIKRAYRALAKRYHPDSAGEQALPRFLAIQAAYEALVAPDPRRAISTPRASTPWSADPARARATRDAYRSGRRGRDAGPEAPGAQRPGTAAPGAPGAGAQRPGAERSGAQAAGSSAPAGEAERSSRAGSPGAGSATGPETARGPRTASDEPRGGPRPGREPGSGATGGAASGATRPAGPSGGRTGGRADDRDGDRANPSGGGTSGKDDRSAEEDAHRSDRGEGPTGDRARRRPSRKATLGSTSYDEAAAGPFEATWDGGTWYGASSGTYWTINPKEYADPRKHGPEYLARARRAGRRSTGTPSAGWSSEELPSSPMADGGDPGAREFDRPTEAVDDARGRGAARDRPGPSGDSTRAGRSGPAWEWTASATDPSSGSDAARPRWESDGRPAGTTAGTTHASSARSTAWPHGATSASGASDPAAASAWRRRAEDHGRGSADLGGSAGDPPPRDPFELVRSDTPLARGVLALAGWPPIGIVLAWLVGEVTGCGRFAATCPAADVPFATATWVLQLGVLGALYAVPAVARVAAVGTLGALAAAIPAAVLLSATGGARDPENASIVLALMLGTAWLAGVLVAATNRIAILRDSGSRSSGSRGS